MGLTMTAGNNARKDSERIVVTGVGVVSPIGIGRDAFWQSLIHGRSGIGLLDSIPSDNLPCKLAAEIKDFDPAKFIRQRKFIKSMSRDIQLGASSATLAMEDAGLKAGDIDPYRLGVVFGAGRISTTPDELAQAVMQSSAGGSEFNFDNFNESSMGQITPLWLLRQLPNMPACHVSIDHDARGPNNTITSRDASCLLALSEAVRTIHRGAADSMIVGACASNIHPVDITKLSLFEGLSRRDDPERACRPFDYQRDGTIVGEGAASFVVERYDHAVQRGADIYAEILAVGAGCDGKGYANGVGGVGLVRAIESTLRQSKIDPKEIGHVNAHGKSTQRDDVVESRAYHKALGDRAEQIPVVALKSYFGHFDAGSGAVELAGSILAVRNGQLPKTLNYETPDPRCRVNVTRGEPINLPNRTALSVNRTMMGQSAAVLLRTI